MRVTAGFAAGIVLLGGSLAGCGDDDGDSGGEEDFADLGYAEIKQAALDAMSRLEALHVVADVASEGQPSTIDIAMSADGHCAGRLTFGTAEAHVLRTPDGAWYKPNEELLAQAYRDRKDKVMEFVGDSWVVDTDDEVTGRNCDLAAFLDQLSDDEEETNTEVGGEETIDGRPVVRLDYTNAEGDGSAYILTEGEHYIVQIDIEGDGAGEAVFSGFDEDVVAEPPGEEEIVDLTEFAD